MRYKKILLLLILVGTGFSGITQGFSLESVKSYPFPTELCAAAKGSRIAWTFNEQGRRNVYVAEGPNYVPIKITSFDKDDAQEISSLSISDNGQWVVFVRGGDHGANWDDELPVNPAAAVNPLKVQLYSVPFAGGEAKAISEGDYPEISPNSDSVVFIKNGQVWIAATNAASPARNLFTTRGTVSQLQWSPDGSTLAFVTNRVDHSLIGMYSRADAPLQWLAPSFNFNSSPRWSPDGRQLAFVQTQGAGGAPDSMLPMRKIPWSVYIANIASGTATLLWKSPATARGSYPTTHGGTNLFWAAGNHIVFLSYQDGWPHLYSIPASGGKEILLTPGNFMAEHISISPDKAWLVFSANTGKDKLDLERRHAVRVRVDQPGIEMIAEGAGLEWTPVVTGDGNTVAFLSATAQRPPLPAVADWKSNAKEWKLLGADKIPLDFPTTQLVVPKQVIFKSADGVTVHADLFEPTATVAKKPAIVYVHGGPPRQMQLGWNYSDYYSNAYALNQYLCSQGFVVLAVNYRLGIGYGFDFHQAPHSGMNGAAEYLDILAAGNWLKKQAGIDPARIGIYGGSYGGYLTALELARDSKLFAAGVDLHGVHDWVAARSMMNLFADKYEKAPDFEKAKQVAWQSSPVASIAGWTSPVLIIHGDDDRNVRFNQSTDLIRRLDKKGVQFETLLIVDDTHHWMKHSNALKICAATADFFKRKL